MSQITSGGETLPFEGYYQFTNGDGTKGGLVHMTSNVDKSVIMHESVVIEEECTICSNVHLGANVTVCRNSIIGENVTIRDVAWIRQHCLIGKNAYILERAIIDEYTVIGDQCRIGPDSHIQHHVNVGDQVLITEDSVIEANVIVKRGSYVEGVMSYSNENHLIRKARYERDLAVAKFFHFTAGLLGGAVMILAYQHWFGH